MAIEETKITTNTKRPKTLINLPMAATSFVVIFFLSHLVFLNSAREGEACKQPCGDLGFISFPFYDTTDRECGGLCEVNCHDKKIKLGNESQWYDVVRISQAHSTISIRDQALEKKLHNPTSCDAFENLSFPNTTSISFSIVENTTFFKCNTSSELSSNTCAEHFSKYSNFKECPGFSLFYSYANEHVFEADTLPGGCSVIQLPVEHKPILPKKKNDRDSNFDDPFKLVTSNFELSFHVSGDCSECHYKGGKCDTNKLNKFHCANLKQDGSKSTVILASVIPGGFVIICILIFIIWRRNKWNYLPYFRTRNTSSDLSNSARDLVGSAVYFGVPVFPYSVLEEATNNFDPSKELGDGGFGTVYHGILRDGREVAVKRLYENNCKRVEQFMNEIEILTRLRHPNLVLLYGCTSRRSTELLLVYEYIPNGTVADHLHGDRAKTGSLTWPIRMTIAIETASALSYLHASDVIHRDVKTNDILLHNNFHVKVADFGLSRLFPIGVTHVSTVPQGTPGYLDPEYHQCYQLTDKSDVYSFGVVLIELISSMPAVDITRHSHEINLANLAINRIQTCAFNELIDPCLGYESDATVERMTTSVAELAFRCLQLDTEMRPTMDEVLETLKDIQDYNCKVEKNVGPPPSPESEGGVLLKIAKFQSSADAVSDKWVSCRSTTPRASG